MSQEIWDDIPGKGDNIKDADSHKLVFGELQNCQVNISEVVNMTLCCS